MGLRPGTTDARAQYQAAGLRLRSPAANPAHYWLPSVPVFPSFLYMSCK
jgi:hypothetical protein